MAYERKTLFALPCTNTDEQQILESIQMFLKWTIEPILHVKHINYMVTFSLVFNQISLVPMHFSLSYFLFESAST